MLVEALESVRRQSWPEVEHCVVDGGSTDGTLELLARRSDVRVIGGPDQGIYDALNKGLAAATGDVIGFLNSDDFYEKGAFEAAATAFARSSECDSVCGAARLVAGGEEVERYSRDEDKRLSPRTALLGSCVLNARFFRRSVFDRLGVFSLRYRVVADREFLLRVTLAGLKTQPIGDLVYTYRRHHASLTFSGDVQNRPLVWRDLLTLAQDYCESNGVPEEARRIARALEGRCIGRLVQTELRQGHLWQACRLLAEKNEMLSLSPLKALAAGLVDAAKSRGGQLQFRAIQQS